MTDNQPLAGRIALVTGASRGIGYAAALALAEAGAHIVALARTQGGLESLADRIEATGGAVTLVPFDLLELDRIDDLGATLYETFGRLDILIGNAGILGPLSPVGHVKAEDWQKVIDLNLNANWRLLRIVDPMLQRSSAGRAIFVTSTAARRTMPFWGPYASSKAALETLVKTYAAELATTPVRANLLDPGPMRTAMRTKAFPGEDPTSLPDPAQLGPLLVKMSSPDFAANGEIIRYDP